MVSGSIFLARLDFTDFSTALHFSLGAGGRAGGRGRNEGRAQHLCRHVSGQVTPGSCNG